MPSTAPPGCSRSSAASAVRSLVLRQGMQVAGIGVAIGLGLGLAMTRLMERLLFGVSATDPAIFAGVAVLLGLVALVSNYVPAFPVINKNVVANFRCFPNHHPHPMIDKEPTPDFRGGVNFNPGQPTEEIGEDPSCKF